MDYGIFNVHTDVNACDCTRGCMDTVRESKDSPFKSGVGQNIAFIASPADKNFAFLFLNLFVYLMSTERLMYFTFLLRSN